MRHDAANILLAAVLTAGLLTGCKPAASLENAAKLEAEGRFQEAAVEYQAYLKIHPTGPLSAWACYKTAKTYEQQGEYEGAIEWYRKVGELHAGSAEEVDALLDLGALYMDRLQDNGNALACYEKALNLYLGRNNIRQAIQALTEAQYLTATAYFNRNDFKRADQVANAILRTYPSVFLPTDTRAKVESLVDRVGRAEAIAQADATLITVREEVAYHKGFDADFPAPLTVDKGTLPSPDQQYVVRQKSTSKGVGLWLGKAAGPKEKAITLRYIPGTLGSSLPSWSPDSKELVFRRIQGTTRTLEKVDVKSRKTRVLFTTPRNTLGRQSVFHPAGNKIAFVWEGNIWLINSNGTNKSMLKLQQRLGGDTQLLWSSDGTMIRYKDKDAKGKPVEGVLILDIAKFDS